MGQPTTFYLEGGHGERYWSGGWHHGIIKALPIKGVHKHWAQIELTAPAWGWSDGKGYNRNGTPLVGNRPRGYYMRDNERVWVSVFNLNEPGDTSYHGPRLDEVVQERKEEKAKDMASAKRAARVSKR